MNEKTTAKRPGADEDAWVRQYQTLTDLAAFLRAHGPASKAPLPALNWTVGQFCAVSAELPSFEPDAQRLAVLDAYAVVLGVTVAGHATADRTLYTVRGRIGRPEGADKQPRITVTLRATVWHVPDETDGGA